VVGSSRLDLRGPRIDLPLARDLTCHPVQREMDSGAEGCPFARRSHFSFVPGDPPAPESIFLDVGGDPFHPRWLPEQPESGGYDLPSCPRG